MDEVGRYWYSYTRSGLGCSFSTWTIGLRLLGTRFILQSSGIVVMDAEAQAKTQFLSRVLYPTSFRPP